MYAYIVFSMSYLQIDDIVLAQSRHNNHSIFPANKIVSRQNFIEEYLSEPSKEYLQIFDDLMNEVKKKYPSPQQGEDFVKVHTARFSNICMRMKNNDCDNDVLISWINFNCTITLNCLIYSMHQYFINCDFADLTIVNIHRICRKFFVWFLNRRQRQTTIRISIICYLRFGFCAISE